LKEEKEIKNEWYVTGNMSDEWRNAVVTPTIRTRPNCYSKTCLFSTWYKIQFKFLIRVTKGLLKQTKFRECLLPFGSESFVIPPAVQECKG
jgi:hypothetical protein